MIHFRVLGPLEVKANGEPIPLGGARQRAVLTALLLDANAVVSAEKLIEDVWGSEAPPSARHTLEVYVSRLRRLLDAATDGARIETRPPGYSLRIPKAALDLERFQELIAAGRQAREEGDRVRAADTLRAALALWRGAALADVQLHSTGAIEAARLDELRLIALEDRVDIELELGRHAALVDELGALVRQHPLRERLRATFMLALYRSGRQADALAAYHQGRRLLRDELGLEPDRALRELAGRIIRQDAALDVAAPTETGIARTDTPGSRARARWRRRSSLVLLALAVLLAAATGTALVLATANDASREHAAGGPPAAGAGPLRVALVLPGGVADVDDFPINPEINEGLQRAEQELGLTPQVFDSGFEPETFRSTLKDVAGERFSLVIAFGVGMDEAVAPVARRFPDTHFVVLDSHTDGTALAGIENVTGVVFSEHEAAYLAGYLAGLTERKRGPRLNDENVISLVGGLPIPPVERYMAGFSAGVEHAFPDVDILDGFSQTWDAQERCATLANEHIAAGADIVFPVAGACGFGALEAALVHNVWGIGVDGDLSYLGPHMLVSVVKRYDRATFLVAKWFAEARLPRGKTIDFNLQANGVGIVGINPAVSPSIRRKLADVAAQIRAGSIVVPSTIRAN